MGAQVGPPEGRKLPGSVRELPGPPQDGAMDSAELFPMDASEGDRQAVPKTFLQRVS